MGSASSSSMFRPVYAASFSKVLWPCSMDFAGFPYASCLAQAQAPTYRKALFQMNLDGHMRRAGDKQRNDASAELW